MWVELNITFAVSLIKVYDNTEFRSYLCEIGEPKCTYMLPQGAASATVNLRKIWGSFKARVHIFSSSSDKIGPRSLKSTEKYSLRSFTADDHIVSSYIFPVLHYVRLLYDYKTIGFIPNYCISLMPETFFFFKWLRVTFHIDSQHHFWLHQ